MKAKIKRLDSSVEIPKYHTPESAAFDFSANEAIEIQPNSVVKVKTGLVIESPEGYFLMISARSSLGTKKNLKLANGIGVVDRDYSGPNDEIILSIHNFSNQVVQIEKGERLAQGMFLPVNQIEWEEVQEMRSQDRGGFGSTGGYSITSKE